MAYLVEKPPRGAQVGQTGILRAGMAVEKQVGSYDSKDLKETSIESLLRIGIGSWEENADYVAHNQSCT
jgi:hypothetical protein